MSLVLNIAPTEEPVSVVEAKQYMHVTADEDDTQIGTMIVAARSLVESYTGRALVTQTWCMTLGNKALFRRIELPKPPVQKIGSITLYDRFDSAITLSDADYDCDVIGGICTVQLHGNMLSAQANLCCHDAVRIVYTVGYGAASAVPDAVKQAVLDITLELYSNRGIASMALPSRIGEQLRAFRIMRL